MCQSMMRVTVTVTSSQALVVLGKFLKVPACFLPAGCSSVLIIIDNHLYRIKFTCRKAIPNGLFLKVLHDWLLMRTNKTFVCIFCFLDYWRILHIWQVLVHLSSNSGVDKKVKKEESARKVKSPVWSGCACQIVSYKKITRRQKQLPIVALEKGVSHCVHTKSEVTFCLAQCNCLILLSSADSLPTGSGPTVQTITLS